MLFELFACWVIFHASVVICLLCLFQNKRLKKKYFRNTIRVSKGLDLIQKGHSVGPYLGPNGLQSLYAEGMKKVNKQCLLDTPRTVRVSENDEYYTKLFTPESSIYQSLYRKNSLSSHRCHFIKKYFFPNQTPSCICSMCLHGIGKVSICSIKSCGWS